VLLREAGEAHEADALVARTETILRARVERSPEAALEGLVAHRLRFTPGSPDTLALARRHAGQRRSGAARLALVRALLAAARSAEAEREVRALLGTRFNTAELHAVAHHVFTAARRPDAAAAEAARAEAMNPRWREQYPST
jgi:hypothetical protein